MGERHAGVFFGAFQGFLPRLAPLPYRAYPCQHLGARLGRHHPRPLGRILQPKSFQCGQARDMSSQQRVAAATIRRAGT